MKVYIIIATFCALFLDVGTLNAQTNTATRTDSTTGQQKKEKKYGLVGIPKLSFDRSRGVGFGAVGMMLIPLDKHASTPPSQFTVTGEYTTKNNWYAMGFGRLFLMDDAFRLSFGGGYLNSNFQTYQVENGSEVMMPYNSYGTFLFAAPYVRVYKHLYVGVGAQYYRSHLKFDSSDETEVTYQNSLGVNLSYDSKDSQYNPSKGLFAMVIYKNFPSWLANDSTFNKLSLQANSYHRLNGDMVLASRVAADIALGSEVPFVAQSYVGNKDIRGYTKGQYRGDQVYAVQSELRWSFYNRWGAVGFLGVALANSPGDTSPLLPGGGVGLRYSILKKFNLNLGLDVAAGKDDWGLYFRIGEAF